MQQVGDAAAHGPGAEVLISPFPSIVGGKVSGLDQLHRQPRFLAGGGKSLVHGGE
jgi:hypothetical protein